MNSTRNIASEKVTATATEIAAQTASAPALDGTLALGLDVGTTSLSAVVTNGEQSAAFSIPNGCDLPADGAFRTQDADAIVERLRALADALIERYPSITAIGVDGQMHGILYVDGEGRAVSPLATWQDARADSPIDGGASAVERILAATGRRVFAGYGLATHYYNFASGLIPDGAVKLCTIGDYAAMRLAGRAEPLIHPTNAASLGLFDVRSARFDEAALSALGIDAAILPGVSASVAPLGEYRDRTVFTAVGDNQAAYFGVMRRGGVLCNFGTGSQVSVAVDEVREGAGVECRPYFAGRYLLSGSALCGGRAFAALERFFRAYVGTGERQYDRLAELSEAGYAEIAAGETPLAVSPLFCGTRDDPTLRGAICGISEDNFTPQALAVGVLRGMVDELYGYFRAMAQPSPDRVTVSGNAARRNPVLTRLVGDIFGASVELSDVAEEAATGAALLALGGEARQ